VIEAFDVSVRLGAKPVLRGIDFAAAAGDVTAIVGPNGSGKTTLLRVLTGELKTAGRVSLNGRPLARMRAHELAADRAVLQQAATLSFPFTVREVVAIGARGDGPPEAISRALARVDLAGFEARLYQELSGGEQQRVQFARVLAQVGEPVGARGPRWLFLDEPVSSLDIRHQLQIMEVARDHARRGGGVIAVMHDLNLTAMHADRIVLMHEGRVRAAGAPSDILRDDLLSEVFGCDLRVGAVPPAGMAFVLPQAAA